MKSISALVSLVALVTPSFSQVTLKTAAPYAALAVKGISSTGTSVITGDMGTTGQSIIGFPPGIVSGTSGAGTAAITTAHADAVTALSTAQALTGATGISSLLGGQTLTPGFYSLERAATLTGNMTLSGNGTFVFQIPSTITTTAGSEVVLTNGAEGSNIFWALGSSATLGASSVFAGNLLATGLITVGAGSSVDGGLFSGSSITLVANKVGATT